MSQLDKLQDEQKESSMDVDSIDRASSGRTAGPSGRCHAVQQEGETWDQDEFAKSDRKKPASVMVEYPAGSNVWYNGVPQKWSSKEVLFRIGVESREEPPCVWIKLTSSRIWRGSNAGNTWTYSGRGSWKPKGGRAGKRDKGAKGKAKPRKRKLIEDNQDSDTQHDDVTCTTKATVQPESDEEDAIEQCPSPLPFKGSNAVSPEGEGPKPSFRGQQDEQDGAHMLKILRDKLVHNEGDQNCRHSNGSSAAVDMKFSNWLYRHYCLLEKQGQLNLAPDGCNPEAGRPLGFLLKGHNLEESLRLRETSSSSGSARQKQEASHNSLAKDRKASLAKRGHDHQIQADLKVSKGKSKHSPFEAPRSPSPSTPSKPADGSRRQRSSSADLDPNSLMAGPAITEKDPKNFAKSGEQTLEHSSRQQQSSGPAGMKDLCIEAKTHLPNTNASQHPQSTAAKGAASKPQASKHGKRVKTDRTSQAFGTVAQANKQQNGVNSKLEERLAPSADSDRTVELERRQSMPSKNLAGAPVSALVETDPFAKNDVVRCKAC